MSGPSHGLAGLLPVCNLSVCGMAVLEQWGSPTTAAPPAHGHEAVFPMTHLRCLAAPFPLCPVSQRKSWAARVPGKGPHRALEHRAPNNPVGVCPSQPSPPPSVLAVGGGGDGRTERRTPGPVPEAGPTPPSSQVHLSCTYSGPRDAPFPEHRTNHRAELARAPAWAEEGPQGAAGASGKTQHLTEHCFLHIEAESTVHHISGS